MKRVFVGVVILAFLVIGCETSDNLSPGGAFAGLAPCMDRKDVRCLYFGLDRDSHWSIQTIHRTLAEIHELADRSYPEHLRRSAYGSWGTEAEADDPPGVFKAYCQRRQCVEKVSLGFGAVVKIVPVNSNTVEIATTRGKRFVMNEADGRWGLGLFKDELQQAKISLLDRLKQVKKNAAEFDEQRLAGVEWK
jgi:hypothetical protein